MKRLFVLVLVAACAAPPVAPTPPADGGQSIVDAAQLAIAEDRPAEAIEPLRTLLASMPDDAHARGVLAHALLAAGELRASRTEGRLALAFDPTLSTVAWNLACAYAREEDAERAIPWLQRALATGAYEPSDVIGDPDLASLREDHRVAVYFATGVLSRAEEDAVALVDRDRGATGAAARLSVALMQLNKPLLSPTDAVLAPMPGTSNVALLERVETFTRGSEGDREYSQRTVHFTFVPLTPGITQLGPFAVTSDSGRSVTTPVLFPVEGEPVTAPAGSADAAWFAFPSQVDGPTVQALVAAGVEPITVAESSPAPDALPELVTLDDGSKARLLRFRALNADAPSWVPPRPPGARRSAMLQRSTEGWSWVLDVIPSG